MIFDAFAQYFSFNPDRYTYKLSFSLLEFFDKSKKWAEMCNLPQPFQKNLDALERNFAVSTFLFNNYFEPMFKSIYTDPADDPPRPPKSRKQR